MHTEEQTKEILKCTNDYKYFISKYAKVLHPVTGIMPIEMKPHISNTLDMYASDKRMVVNVSCRQSGKSLTTLVYALWCLLFKIDFRIMYLCKSNADALDACHRFRLMFECLPEFFRENIKEYTKKIVSLENGSRICFSAASESSGRGHVLNLVIVDDAAYVKSNTLETMVASLFPFVGIGTKMIFASTFSEKKHYFCNIASIADEDESLIMFDWKDIGFDPSTMKELRMLIGNERFALEYENVL